MDIQVKRVYEPAEDDDGMRILVDRIWPRGVKREMLAYDDWAKVLAPSTEARKAFAHKAENFAEFRGRYLSELDTSEAAAAYVESLQAAQPSRVTLLYAARDPRINHAVILRDWLAARLS